MHSHSFYSISDGLFSPRQWSKALKDRGFKAHALTDHGSMAGLLPFYHSMKEEGLTPIMGVEFYFVDDPLDKTEANRSAAHLILIAKNEEGWKNLLMLSRLSYEQGFYYRPRIGLEWVTKYSDGLICLTACLGGILSKEIWKEKEKKTCLGLIDRFKQFSAIFKDDLYVEFQGHDADEQRHVNERLKTLESLPLFKPVVTNDCHYINQEHSKVQVLVKSSAFRNAEAAASYTHFDSLWLKKPKDVYDSFLEHHETLGKRFIISGMQSTHEIFEKCVDFKLPQKRYLPKYGDDSSFFKRLSLRMLKEFLDKDDFRFATKKEYVDRFKKEYDVITGYGLQDYFLLVWDIVEFARSKGIYVGIGRGSSAGSFICFLLGIVKINPLQYNLIFERFLNAIRCETGPNINFKEFPREKYDATI